MAESSPPPVTPRATLGLTGLTSNAMALIAPGAFLWLTYSMQSAYGAPAAGMSMWLGIALATLLCLATAVSYAELSKLYPGAGSSYFFTEQAFLSKKQAFKFARLFKFIVGWASHLYYWVYPGVMVGVTALVAGYMIGQIFPTYFNASVPSPLFMILFCVVFAFGVSYIAYRGVGGTTGINAAINVVQITALIIFSCMAILHRVHVKEGDPCWTLDSTGALTQNNQDQMPDTTKMIQDPKFPNDPTKQIVDPAAALVSKVDSSGAPVWIMIAADKAGKPVNDAAGNPIIVPTDANGKLPNDPEFVGPDGKKGAVGLPAGVVNAVPQPFTTSYVNGVTTDSKTGITTFNYHISAGSVLHPHKIQYVFIQACIAILILVGFESVTAMGEEAKNAKRDIPKAVILSLLIQGCFCYLFEYFAANFFLGSHYTNTTAAASSAPIGDMMQIAGAWAFKSAAGGKLFMMLEGVTVLLALIGTTLSCMTTASRVTYAMGRDEEVASHFGLLHGKNQTPHTAIWTLAIISTVIGIFAVYFNFCGPSVQTDATIAGLPQNMWYKFGIFKNATAASLPSSMLIVTLVSNFGTFLLYMMTCIVAIVAFREHHSFSGFKHVVVPVFGLLANLGCMLFYLVGPFTVPGMSFKEPYFALGVAGVWGIYGAIYFLLRSKKAGKPIILQAPPTPVIL